MKKSADIRTQLEIETPYGPCHELTTRYFFDHVLPPLRRGLDPASILATLRSSRKPGIARLITKQARWRGFAKDPAQCQHTPYQTFKHLEGVVKAIQVAVKTSDPSLNIKDPELHFENNPDAVPDRTSEKSFPDAYFWQESEHTWQSIAVCGEYQKGDSSDDIDENVEKVTRSMARLMFENPRRRFAIGFTIENVSMRIWFCDRWNILVSQPFHFITNHQYVVHFFLSILYAEPHQLGWDPTMVSLPDGQNFDITVTSGEQARTYRTREILSDRGSRELLGKATRVWKAIRVEGGEETGPAVVLKDCWVKMSNPREGENIRCIRKAILAQEETDSTQSLFLNVEWDGDTRIQMDEALLDSTLFVANASFAQPSSTRKEHTDISGENTLVHYRVVVSPVSTGSLHGQTSLPIIYKSLSQVARALRSMHRAGWVHRDISTGNILVNDGQTLLADFEFAKQASGNDNFTLGTDYFKAVEVDMASYCFEPEPEPEPLDLEGLPATAGEMLAMALRDFSPVKSTPSSPKQPRSPSLYPAIQAPSPEHDSLVIVPLRYNPLHDLESLWWIAVYFVIKKEISLASTASAVKHAAEWSRDAQCTYADKLFFGEDYRLVTMSIPGKFLSNGRRVVDRVLRPVVTILDSLRGALMTRYTEIEKDAASIDWKCADRLYESFITGFTKIANRHQLQDVHLIPILDPFYDPSSPAIVIEENTQLVEEIKDAQTTTPEDVGKGEKTKRQRRKPVAQTHRYNLRPRPRRG